MSDQEETKTEPVEEKNVIQMIVNADDARTATIVALYLKHKDAVAEVNKAIQDAANNGNGTCDVLSFRKGTGNGGRPDPGEEQAIAIRVLCMHKGFVVESRTDARNYGLSYLHISW